MTADADGRPAPVLLNGGVGLRSWIESGGPPARQVPIGGLRQRWAGFWFERYAAITARRCATLALPTDLTFIVGLWRTGSTVLHTILTEATDWTTPKTWQCFRPADFLLAPAPREMQVRRPMDQGEIGTFSPQEDEFAALLLGDASVYRAFIDPRRFDELALLLHQWRDFPNHDVAPLSVRWETFVKAVSLQAPGPLLLKSPNHTFRLPWLAKRFPEARFIWLTRPTVDVLASNRRMWTAMIERYGLWDHDPAVLEAFIRKAVVNHDDLLDWARHEIPERIHEITFQEVMQDRAKVVPKILDSLGIPRLEIADTANRQ